MANNIHVRCYLLFALLVFLVVFRQVVVVSDQPSAFGSQLPAISPPLIVISTAAQRNGEISALTAGSTEENLVRNKIKQIYSAEIGVREATGKNDGRRVEEYLALTNLGKGYAWCASFISWVFSEAGFPEPRTPWSPALFPKERVIWERGHQLSAISNQPNDLRNFAGFVGGEISSVLKVSTSTQVLKPNALHLTPKAGDVFGIYFNNLKRIAHAGFVDEWGSTFIITVEGNTNEAGSAEGDGVYRRRRPIGSIHSVASWIDRPKDGQNYF